MIISPRDFCRFFLPIKGGFLHSEIVGADAVWCDVGFVIYPMFSTQESLETWWMYTTFDSLETVFHVHCDYLRYILKFKGAALNSCWTQKWHWFGLLKGYSMKPTAISHSTSWDADMIFMIPWCKKNRIPVLFHSFLMVVSHTVPQLLW